MLVIQLSAAVDDPLSGAEARLAALAHCVGQGAGHVAGGLGTEVSTGRGEAEQALRHALDTPPPSRG